MRRKPILLVLIFSVFFVLNLPGASSAPPTFVAPVLSASVTGTEVSLTWTDAGGENSYYVMRLPPAAVTWTQIAQLHANTLQYKDSGLSPSTTYHYVVVATRGWKQMNANAAQVTTGVTPSLAPSSSPSPSLSLAPSPSPSLSLPPSPSPSPTPSLSPVTTPGATASSAASFTVTAPPPTCTGVTVTPASNIQALVNAAPDPPAHTTFCFATGTYLRTSTITTSGKLITFDLRAGADPDAILDGQNGNFMGLSGPVDLPGPTILGGVFQHFGNTTTAPDWAGGMVLRDNGVVDGTEFRFNANTGLGVSGDHARVANAYIHDNGRYGLVVTPGCAGCPGAVGVVIENSEIAFNNTRHLDPSYDAGGTKFSGGTDGMIVRNNLVHDNYGAGLWWDGHNRNAQVYGNTIYSNAQWGIFWEISYDASIHDNVLTNNGAGSPTGDSWLNSVQLLVSCSDGTDGGTGGVIDIYNNTIDGTAKAVGAISFNHGFAAGNQTKSVYVHDNTIILRGSGAKVGGSDQSGGTYAGMWSPGNIRFDFNHYFVLDTAAVHFEWQGNKTGTQWRAVPQDANGTISPI